MTDRRTALVAAGYDAMADTWEAWSSRVSDDPRFDWLERLASRLPDGAHVAQLGCGNGTAETRALAARFDLTAVDLSTEQLRRARERVPGATFVHADLTTVAFDEGSLDAVCAFYVLNHVPRELLPGLFEHIRTWLRPGGLFLATLGASDVAGWEGEWLGVPMYFSGHEPARNRELLSNFELVDDEVVTISEPEGPVSFHWILGATMTCDFSLAHYRELLRAAKEGGYRWTGFARPPEPGDLILRHDVDLSLDGALAVAAVEAEEGAWSTWFLMTRSVFYNLDSAEGERAVARLRELGHRVAHHAVWPHVDLDDRFDAVVAWHNPDPQYMRAPIEGAVNVMEAPFFDPDHYRSDSNQHWRHGCPHEQLAAGRFEWLQLLTHPEIWAFGGATMRETMESMLDADLAARFEHLRADRIDLS